MNLKDMLVLREKIRKEMNVDVEDLDFTTLEDGVYCVDDWGKSYLLTNNIQYIKLFKTYENLRYGEIN